MGNSDSDIVITSCSLVVATSVAGYAARTIEVVPTNQMMRWLHAEIELMMTV